MLPTCNRQFDPGHPHSMIKEKWLRDDGWEVWLSRKDNEILFMSYLPLAPGERPKPLTYEYVIGILKAYGYMKELEFEVDYDNVRCW